jgi:hypothetical protein
MVGMMQPSASDGVAIMILVVLSVSLAGNRGGDARCETTNGQTCTPLKVMVRSKWLIAQIRNHKAERNALVRDGTDSRHARLAPIMALVHRVAYCHRRSTGYCTSWMLRWMDPVRVPSPKTLDQSGARHHLNGIAFCLSIELLIVVEGNVGQDQLGQVSQVAPVILKQNITGAPHKLETDSLELAQVTILSQ